MTHTYVIMGLSWLAFDEIAARIDAADYGHAVMEGGEIDMHGIAVKAREPCPPAIKELMRTQDLSAHAVMRQALAYYQMHCRRIHAGETCTYSGDAARAAEFAGPLANTPGGGHG